MDQRIDMARQCVECGNLIRRFKSRFCSAECFERWMEDEKTGIHLKPGYSLLAGKEAECPTEK